MLAQRQHSTQSLAQLHHACCAEAAGVPAACTSAVVAVAPLWPQGTTPAVCVSRQVLERIRRTALCGQLLNVSYRQSILPVLKLM